MSDLMLIAITAPFIALCIGHFLGKRSEAAYWADHGEHGGSVHHRGRFYRVTKERGQ